jgi:uncharacterized oxidoreductase
MDLRNNTILITGGTSGFGYEFAKQLLPLGNTIILTGRNQVKLDQAKRQLPGVHTFQSDVSDPAAIEDLYQQVVNQFPALNILINNAGEMRRLNLNDPAVDLHDVTREVDINLLGPIRMVQQFLPHLKTKKSAAILNVSSGIALVPFPLSPVYGGTKAGLHSYTQSLRVQLRQTAVKVFELLAPAAKTPLGDKFAGDTDNIPTMEPAQVVAKALKALQRDHWEVYPGLSTALRYMSRIAPGFLLNQMSKPFEKAFGQLKA